LRTKLLLEGPLYPPEGRKERRENAGKRLCFSRTPQKRGKKHRKTKRRPSKAREIPTFQIKFPINFCVRMGDRRTKNPPHKRGKRGVQPSREDARESWKLKSTSPKPLKRKRGRERDV